MRTRFFVCVFAFLVLLCVSFLFIKPFYLHSENKSDISFERKTPPVITTEKKEKPKYFLSLEDDNLCAYEEENGKRNLLRLSKTVPMLMNKEEVKKLKEGIYAESYEDLFLFFESYLS